MRICWWTPQPTTYQTTLIEALRAAGVDIEVCYFWPGYDAERLAMGWRERALSSWEHRVKGLSAARRVVPDFDERIQMVPGFFHLTGWKLILWCALKGLPWFAVTEGTRGRWTTRPLFRLFCRFVNRFAQKLFVEGGTRTCSQFAAAGVRAEKIVPFAYATMRPPADLIREEHDGTTFVFAGSFCARKAVDVIAAVWKRLVVEFPTARLILAGGGDLARLFDGLANVEMAGPVPQEKIYEVIRRGDVMLLPSRYDAWGVALAEGARMGLAMIGSDRTGAADALLEDGVNGYLVKAGDADGLLRVMRLYASDQSLARRHGEAARLTSERTSGEQLAQVLVRELTTDMVAASFWEEHCTECGEPDCYRTCAKFTKGPGGRCRRFVGGLKETILNRGVETQFLPWGKMEALFHGRMISRPQAEELERLMTRTSWIRRIFPRWWRSWRWRWALLGSAKGVPNVWRCALTAERDEKLMFAVVGKRDEDIASTVIELKAGTRKESEIILPSVEKGTLFRIFPVNGEGTGGIRFEYNELVYSAREDTSSTVKCVAWDLDGTLWQGILSEDGAEGLTLNDKAVALLKELDGRGIVNSIVSRNDSEPALAALRKFGLEEYFVFPQINWGPKSEGIRNLAREMNIAVDAIAFIDDREEMRNEVRTNLPEVRVFAADEIPALGQRPEFNPPVSAESAGRRLRYREEMARRGAMRTEFAGDAAAFLKASGLQFELQPVEGDAVTRCRELVQRTNQLNLTGRRYDEAAFAALLSAADCKAVHVWDRYGDYGIVGFAAMKGTHLVEFCFSCRVAEKGIERQVLEKLANGRTLTADIVETPRNGKIREIVREWC